MAFELISSNVTTGYSIVSSTELTILEGVVVSNGELDTITGGTADLSNIDINLLGTIVSGDAGINLYDGTVTSVTTANIFIAETGTIISDSFGMIIDQPDDVSIVNLGTIRATSDAIQFATLQGNVNILNSGTMSSDEGVMFISGGGTAYIDNLGLMTGDGDLNDGVIESSSETIVINSGTITGYNGYAMETASQDDEVRNSGTINGAVDLGFGSNIVGNSGLIVGNIITNTGNDDIANTGTIDGDVNSSAGTNSVSNFGFMTGDVNLGSGFDTVTNGGVIGGAVFLAGGADEYRALGDGAALDGIYGGDGDDVIRLGAADDFAFGEGDNDSLFGGAGDDELFGGSGEDVLRGGTGTNTLNGGENADLLIGQSGAFDTFVWENTTDSLSSETDTVRGFSKDEDLLDLSGLAMSGFQYMGSSQFSGTGPSVRVTEGPNNSLVRIDVDGDGSNDMRIFVSTFGLTELDFIL